MSSSPSMTDIERARKQLETLQRNSFVQLGMSVPTPAKLSEDEEWERFDAYLASDPDYTEEDRRKHFKEGKARRAENNLPIAAFADDVSNKILQHCLNELKSVWPEHRFPGALAKICFGLIPGGGLDAYTFRADESDAYCVVIPDGFLFLTNLFTKLVVLLQPWTPTHQGLVYMPSASFAQFSLAGHPYIKFRTRDLLRAYFVDGEPQAALPYVSAIPYQDHLSYLLGGTELFVIAHEVAHVALGHLEDFDGNEYDLNAELAADTLAFEVVQALFNQTMNLGHARASLCQALFLSITRLWEHGVQYAFRELGTFRSESHPSFKQRHNHFVASLSSEKSETTPSWYIHVHSAIRIATEMMANDVLEGIITEAGGIGGLSARVLPASHADLGQMKTPRTDVWALTIGRLLVAEDRVDRRLGLWFLARMAPYSAITLYEGIVDDDETVKTLCRDALCSVEPIYKSYMPRLLERFREEDKEDSLAEYKMQIASHLTGKASLELGEERMNSDPMAPGFFDA
jgi:hypothetical protein